MDAPRQRLKWLLEDRHRWVLHLAFWLFIYLDEILSLTGVIDTTFYKPLNVLALFLMDAITVYFNLYLLIGSYLINGRLLKYLGFTLISILINIQFSFLIKYNIFQADLTQIPETSVLSQLITDFAFTTFMLGTAIGSYMLRRYVKGQELIRALRTEKLAAELEFLKNQINPHFLFNSLNNIYVLTKTNQTQASESVLLLSDLLRYQLYDCSKDYVKLSSEISYLKNYLDLERIRRTRSHIEMTVHGDPSDIKVSPFLFMPFVENAIKHGTSLKNKTSIKITFTISNSKVIFEIANGVDRSIPRDTSKPGGIGLKNVRRRLNLLYPKRHKLKIQVLDDRHIVWLSLDLK